MRVLSSGVDTIHVAAKGMVRASVWSLLEDAKTKAKQAEEAVPFEFPLSGRRFDVKPHGLRGYSYWLTSPDVELVLGRSDRFPPVLVQFHSAYLHSLGVPMAVELINELLCHEVFAVPPELQCSRIDLYADIQGWELTLQDLRRFVCLGRNRRGFQAERQVYASGHRLTGFVFGRDAVVARIYDKTTEIRRRGLAWLPELWGDRDDERPVWRVEFQLRREVLKEFDVHSLDEALAGAQDLWHYVTERWLTYRQPTADARERRWPLDPTWQVVQQVEIVPVRCGRVRQRLEEATEERLIQGGLGYLTSWAALRGRFELHDTLEAIGPVLERYLASRERTFPAEVRRKLARRMEVTEGRTAETAA